MAAETAVRVRLRAVGNRVFAGHHEQIRGVGADRLAGLAVPTAFNERLEIGGKQLEVAAHKLDVVENLVEFKPDIAGPLIGEHGVVLGADSIAADAVDA